MIETTFSAIKRTHGRAEYARRPLKLRKMIHKATVYNFRRTVRYALMLLSSGSTEQKFDLSSGKIATSIQYSEGSVASHTSYKNVFNTAKI